jgi:hypothetical protein
MDEILKFHGEFLEKIIQEMNVCLEEGVTRMIAFISNFLRLFATVEVRNSDRTEVFEELFVSFVQEMTTGKKSKFSDQIREMYSQ